MFRFIATAVVAALLLAIALVTHGRAEPAPAETAPRVAKTTPPAGAPPRVSTRSVDGGVDLTVRHRFAGAVSRATLVYELDGDDQVMDGTSSCRQALDPTSKVRTDGYATEVTLAGHLPDGASAIRLVLEAETGTTVLPVALN